MFGTEVNCVCIVQCFCCVFFFFQAEDGIRDLTVTGVQTCALPILAGVNRLRFLSRNDAIQKESGWKESGARSYEQKPDFEQEKPAFFSSHLFSEDRKSVV